MHTGQEEYSTKKRFLYGESMGGAVALLIHKKDPSFWHGAVLVAPMCKVKIYIYIYILNFPKEKRKGIPRL